MTYRIISVLVICSNRNLNRKKADYHKYKLDDLMSVINDSKSFWSKLKNMTNKKERQANSITTEQWLDHFKTLFNDGNDIENDIGDDINELDIELDEPSDEIEEHIFNSEITYDKIVTAIRSMKRGKAPGPDGLIPELYIYGIDTLLPLFNRLFNRLFRHGEYPEEWCNSIITTLYKKGDTNDVNNYREISLQNIFSKIYASSINRRLQFFAQIYNKISEAQAGAIFLYRFWLLCACVNEPVLATRRMLPIDRKCCPEHARNTIKWYQRACSQLQIPIGCEPLSKHKK